jgi:hypothetical protein
VEHRYGICPRRIFLRFWLSVIPISLTMVIIPASKHQTAKGPT